MGTATVKSKAKSEPGTLSQARERIEIKIDSNRQILLEVRQLTNFSLDEIKGMYHTYQRISSSPMMDRFVFSKILPLNKRNSALLFSLMCCGRKYISILELVSFLVLTSYQTYRKKFQFLCLIFDLQHKGNMNGREFMLLFYSMIYGYCRATGHEFPDFKKVEKYAHATFFQGEEDFSQKPFTLQRLIQQYDGNSNISQLFSRFEQLEFKDIKDNPTLYCFAGLSKYSQFETNKFYSILYNVYSKNDYQQVELLESSREMRRNNRRDSCYRQLLEQKLKLGHSSPSITRHHASTRRFSQYNTPQSEKQAQFTPRPSSKGQQKFRIKKVMSTHKIKPKERKNIIFLNGSAHSKGEVFQVIHYYKTFSTTHEKVTIKEFFKKFEKRMFMKKQLSSIFRYLDYEKKGEITLRGFFKAFFPGLTEEDFKVLKKWYEDYEQIYEADSLSRNQIKVTVMSDARELPPDTLDRMREIFRAMDIGTKGYLTFEDLRKSYRQGFTADEIENLIKQYGDGKTLQLSGLCKMLLPYGWSIEGVNIDKVTLE